MDERRSHHFACKRQFGCEHLRRTATLPVGDTSSIRTLANCKSSTDRPTNTAESLPDADKKRLFLSAAGSLSGVVSFPLGTANFKKINENNQSNDNANSIFTWLQVVQVDQGLTTHSPGQATRHGRSLLGLLAGSQIASSTTNPSTALMHLLIICRSIKVFSTTITTMQQLSNKVIELRGWIDPFHHYFSSFCRACTDLHFILFT